MPTNKTLYAVMTHKMICNVCRDSEEDSCVTQVAFVRDNRRRGWRIRDKEWTCPTCVWKIEVADGKDN